MEPQNNGQLLTKTVLKRKNDKFWVMPLKHVLSFINLVNHYGIPKLLAIAHENSPKTQKLRVFGHASQICIECHGPYKSLWNPKTVGNIS
jgi:hypothetical protein